MGKKNFIKTKMQTHIIGKQIIELGLGPEQDAFGMQQEVSWILQNQVMPRLETLLDRMISPDLVVRLDQLEVDLGLFKSRVAGERFYRNSASPL